MAEKTASKAAPAKAAGDRGPSTPRAPRSRAVGVRPASATWSATRCRRPSWSSSKTAVRHPLYGKIIRTTTKVKAHDENGIAGVGDRVSLMETRPLSATKRWRLVEILEKAK